MKFAKNSIVLFASGLPWRELLGDIVWVFPGKGNILRMAASRKDVSLVVAELDRSIGKCFANCI